MRTTHHIRSAIGGWQVYHHDDWGHVRLDGPVWPSGKQARDYVDALDIASELANPLRPEPSHTPSSRPVAGDSAPTEGPPGEVMELWGK